MHRIDLHKITYILTSYLPFSVNQYKVTTMCSELARNNIQYLSLNGFYIHPCISSILSGYLC